MNVLGPGEPHAANNGFSLHAWVDESMRIRSDDSGTYIFASVVCDPTRSDSVRHELTSFLLRGQRRLHWRDEGSARRDKLAALLATVDMAAVVAVGMPLAKAKQERARRLCMEALVPRLDAMGVSRVWLESRTPSLNKADAKMVLALRGKRLIRPDLRMDVARPIDEPMLWVPDIVAGAVGADRGGDPRWLEPMRSAVTQIEVKLR